ARELGLAVGISSGGNMAAAIKLQHAMGENAVVVTVIADDNKKYLSTDLVKEHKAEEHYISSDLKFVDFKAIKV
ncbi:MAG: hypothetical protein LBN71_10435, partial [Tannerella sp.]|nr:hypothetical protein [Tannerella sp.]